MSSIPTRFAELVSPPSPPTLLTVTPLSPCMAIVFHLSACIVSQHLVVVSLDIGSDLKTPPWIQNHVASNSISF